MSIEAMKQAKQVIAMMGVPNPLNFSKEEIIAWQKCNADLDQAIAEAEKQDGYCQVCDGNSCTAKRGCVALDNPPEAEKQEPVAWEPLTDSQIMASVGRHAGGEKTSISESRPLGQQWEQVCELVRKIIAERYTSPSQRQWVGLTKTEVVDALCEHSKLKGNVGLQDLIYITEAKLKDKNIKEQP